LHVCRLGRCGGNGRFLFGGKVVLFQNKGLFPELAPLKAVPQTAERRKSLVMQKLEGDADKSMSESKQKTERKEKLDKSKQNNPSSERKDESKQKNQSSAGEKNQTIVADKNRENDSKRKELDPFLRLVRLQEFDGKWSASEELASIVQIDLQKLKSEGANVDARVWASAIAIAVLNLRFLWYKVEWELLAARAGIDPELVKKAMDWIRTM
jgi:hypothetical protein